MTYAERARQGFGQLVAVTLLTLVLLAWAGRWADRGHQGEQAHRPTLLLALGLAGPDALAASWDVDRFERTGKNDVDYLGNLSDDAVPALDRLPQRLRGCALADRVPRHDPWYAANVARIRAAARLPVAVPSDCFSLQ